jgi:protein SCO1/2
MKLLSTLIFGLVLLLAGCSQPKQFISTDLSMVEWGKDFSLTDHNGQARRLGDFKGKAVVLFFGYTQCLPHHAVDPARSHDAARR